MELRASEREDITRYYKGTYVKLPQFGEKLFFVYEVTPQWVMLKDSSDEVFRVLLANDDEPAFSFEYVLPHKAVFAHKGTVYQLQRVPARQYYRGCHPNNTAIIEVASGSRQEISFALLEAFVQKPEYLSFEQAVTARRRGSGVAISPRWSYSKNQGILYLDTTAIGVYTDVGTTMTILQGREIVAPEIKALAARTGFQLKVVDANNKPI